MTRQAKLFVLVLGVLLALGWLRIHRSPRILPSVQQENVPMAAEPVNPEASLPKTDAEWKKRLTPEQYRVTREKGTEAPFSGEYYRTDREGVYRCVCCGTPLFSSEMKFDAHCGWPSFWKAINEGNLKTLEDHSHGMDRVEVQCRNCGAHLGHLFDDGPEPTGLRYCINSVSLKLDEKKPQERKP